MDIPQERKLVTEVPGPRSAELFARRAEAIPTGVANIHPVVTARASGAIVEDVDGNRLIDLATGIAVLNAGHSGASLIHCQGAEPWCAAALIEAGHNPAGLIHCQGVDPSCAVTMMRNGRNPAELIHCR